MWEHYEDYTLRALVHTMDEGIHGGYESIEHYTLLTVRRVGAAECIRVKAEPFTLVHSDPWWCGALEVRSPRVLHHHGYGMASGSRTDYRICHAMCSLDTAQVDSQRYLPDTSTVTWL